MRRTRLASALALAVFATPTAFADTLYWNGGNYGYGTYNWTSTQFPAEFNHVPQAGDSAYIGGGSALLINGDSRTVQDLYLQGSGGLDGPGTLVVTGVFDQTTSSGGVGSNLVLQGASSWGLGNWNTSYAATTTVAATGSLTISPGASDMLGRSLANYGLVSHTSYAVRGGGNSTACTIDNFGTWSEDSTVYDTQINQDLGGAGATFANHAGATFRKTTSLATTLNLPFDNSGTVDTQAGSLYLSRGGLASDGALFRASANAGNYVSSAYSLAGTVTFSGAGTNAVIAGGQMAGNWALAGTLSWTGGNFSTADATTILPGASLLLANAGDNDMASHTFVNLGTATLQAGRLRGGASGSLFLNRSLFVDATTSDTQLNNDYGGPGLTFSNAATGTYRKTGASTTLAYANFANDGTLDVQAGGMYLYQGTSTAGSALNVGAAGTLGFGGYNVASGVTWSGAGLFEVFQGANTFAGTIGAQQFAFVGGSSGFASATFTGGTVSWSGGSWGGGGTVTVGPTGRLLISTAQADLPSTTLANYGTVTWAGSGTIRGGAGGTLIVNAGAWVDSNAASGVYNNDYGGNGLAFSNAASGVYRKVGAGTTVFSGLPFYNDGLLDVGAGAVVLYSGSASAGSAFNVAAGATLSLNGYTVAGNVSYGGAGTYQLTSAVNSLSGTVNAKQLAIAGGTNALLDVTFSGSTVTWTGGIVNQGSATVAASSSLVINSAPADLPSTTLVNNGTVTHLGGSVRGGQAGSAIVNNGLWLESTATDVLFNSDYGGNGLSFTNSAGATLRRTAGTYTQFSGVPLYQHGTVDAQAGAIYVSGGGQAFDGATFNAAAGATVSFTSNYDLEGTIHMTGAGSVVLSGGTMSGNHAIDGTFRWDAGNFNSVGTTLIRAGSTFVVSASSADYAGREFDIAGTFVHAYASLRGGGPGSVINNDGLFLEASPVDDQINGDYSGNGVVFNNRATFRKTSSSYVDIRNVTFNNSGLFDLQAGTVYFTGSLVASNGSTINAAAGTYDFLNSPDLSGTVTFSGAGLHQLYAGTLTGTHVVAGNIEWAGGNLNSAGTTTIPTGYTWTVDAAPADLAGRTIELYGTVNHSNGNLRGGAAGSTLDNHGLFLETSAADDQINGEYNGNGFTFNNDSTFRKTGSGITYVSNVAFYNYGFVDVRAGTLYFLNSLIATDGSTVNTGAAGTAVYLNNPTLNGTVTFSGSGTRQFYSGTLSGNQVIRGRLDWVGGNLNTGGYTEIAFGGAMEISPGRADLAGHTFVYRGAVAQDAISLRGGGAGSLVVNYGTWTEAGAGDRQINGEYNGNGLAFSNASTGTLSIASAATSLTLSNVAFSNAGLLDVGLGALTVTNGAAFYQTSGVTHLGGGTIAGSSLLQYSGGSISGTGTISSPVIAAYTTIAPIAPNGYLALASLKVAAPVAVPPRNPLNALPSLVVVNSLSFTGTGVLDLSDNDMLLRGPAESDARAFVVAGLLVGAYGNPYAGVGVITNIDGLGGALYATYDGQPATSADVLVKYTYLGDTDLTGAVDASDLANYLAGRAGGLTGWLNGDFNYDGTVDNADLALLLTSLQHQTVSFGASGGPSGAVPEPEMLAMFLPATLLTRRRRR